MLPGFLYVDQRAAFQSQFTDTVWVPEIKPVVQAAFKPCYLLRCLQEASLPSYHVGLRKKETRSRLEHTLECIEIPNSLFVSSVCLSVSL